MSIRRKPVDQAALHVPAHLRPYVDVLGVDDAVEFLLTFGGGYSYFSASPDAASPIAKAVGADRAAALARSTGGGSMRIPTGKPFIARALAARGLGASAIARKLHVSDVAVRGWLADESRQLTLFDLPSSG